MTKLSDLLGLGTGLTEAEQHIVLRNLEAMEALTEDGIPPVTAAEFVLALVAHQPEADTEKAAEHAVALRRIFRGEE